MGTIGLFYAKSAVKTAQIANKICEKFGPDHVKTILVEEAWGPDFAACDNLIVGASTWFDGELPTCWDELIPELKSLDLKGKKVALFGLGDQKGYPDNFADGVGILAEVFESAGATLVGLTPSEDYTFNHSRALREDGLWSGLILDQENQAKQTKGRIEKWCEQIKKEF